MPASNVTITVEFVKITDGGNPTTPTTDGGEDNGIDEPPVTTNEYTVSVASGIKGGHFEVSPNGTEGSWSEITSKTYTKDTTIYVRPVCNNSFYKLVSNTVKYTLSKGGEGFLSDNGGCITITDNTILGATFEISQGNLSTLNGEITSGTSYGSNLKCGVFIYYTRKTFTDTYKNVKIVFGFDENYYGGLTISNSVDGITYKTKPNYYYVCNTEITQFSKDHGDDVVFVSITGNDFTLPLDTGKTGRVYVLAETNEGNKIMFPAAQDFSSKKIKYAVEIN